MWGVRGGGARYFKGIGGGLKEGWGVAGEGGARVGRGWEVGCPGRGGVDWLGILRSKGRRVGRGRGMVLGRRFGTGGGGG